MTGPGILIVEDDVGNTRTKFVALRKCNVEISFSARQSGANTASVYKNGVVVKDSTQAFTNTATIECSASLSLEIGDYITIGSVSNINNASYTFLVTLNATAQVEHLVTNQSLMPNEQPGL